jgi:recombination protein RecR
MFHGKYHVLNGLISPLDGINPEDIGLSQLLNRIRNENFKEIIFAFKPSIEGETTALYIKKILEGLNIKITRLASGVPIGADMEYVDSLTLERALNDRKIIE